ncbi:hypothetical protein B566_EDAN012216 [Ephemera danica]|nr:hypothetical protein B566_EDAN012216 [Ephemera danica]
MASESEASCIADPNFAVICSFLERFAESCGILHPSFTELQDMLENSEEVDGQLVDLHVKLLRKARKSVSAEKWERALLSGRLGAGEGLLEAQFDLNARFKAAVNKLTASELRTKPLGRDSQGQVYWSQQDAALNLRVYREDEQEETWSLIAKDRESLAQLISTLSGGRLDAEALAIAEGEEEEEEEELSSSVDDDDEAAQGQILLDTGQPEDAQPPGILPTNGSAADPVSDTPAPDTEEQKSEESTEDGQKEEKPCEEPVAATDPVEAKAEDEEKRLESTPAGGEQAVNLSIPSLLPSQILKRKLDEPAEPSKRPCPEPKPEDEEFGEAIEEPLMLVTGPGAGAECDTGNPGEGKDAEKKEEKKESPPKPPRVSRWDNSNVSPPKGAEKAPASSPSSSGMVSEWVRKEESEQASPQKEQETSKPSIFSPSKSSLWSIDKICGTSSAPSQPSSVFSAGMLFGNLSKPSFSQSPERPKLTSSPMAFNLDPVKPTETLACTSQEVSPGDTPQSEKLSSSNEPEKSSETPPDVSCSDKAESLVPSEVIATPSEPSETKTQPSDLSEIKIQSSEISEIKIQSSEASEISQPEKATSPCSEPSESESAQEAKVSEPSEISQPEKSTSEAEFSGPSESKSSEPDEISNFEKSKSPEPSAILHLDVSKSSESTEILHSERLNSPEPSESLPFDKTKMSDPSESLLSEKSKSLEPSESSEASETLSSEKPASEPKFPEPDSTLESKSSELCEVSEKSVHDLQTPEKVEEEKVEETTETSASSSKQEDGGKGNSLSKIFSAYGDDDEDSQSTDTPEPMTKQGQLCIPEIKVTQYLSPQASPASFTRSDTSSPSRLEPIATKSVNPSACQSVSAGPKSPVSFDNSAAVSESVVVLKEDPVSISISASPKGLPEAIDSDVTPIEPSPTEALEKPSPSLGVAQSDSVEKPSSSIGLNEAQTSELAPTESCASLKETSDLAPSESIEKPSSPSIVLKVKEAQSSGSDLLDASSSKTTEKTPSLRTSSLVFKEAQTSGPTETSPGLRTSPLSFKGGRRKSLDMISLSIMKEKMKSHSPVEADETPVFFARDTFVSKPGPSIMKPMEDRHAMFEKKQQLLDTFSKSSDSMDSTEPMDVDMEGDVEPMEVDTSSSEKSDKIEDVPALEKSESAPTLEPTEVAPLLEKSEIDPTVAENVPTLEISNDTPSLEKLESASTLEKSDDVPSSKKSESIPLEKSDNSPSLDKSDISPTLEKPDSAPMLENLDDSPSLEDSKNAPTSKQPENIPTLEKSENARSLEKSENVPRLEEPKSVPTLEKSEDALSLEKLENIPILEKSENIPTLEKSAETPSIDKSDETPSIEKSDETPPIEKSDDAPTLEEPESAPLLEKAGEAEVQETKSEVDAKPCESEKKDQGISEVASPTPELVPEEVSIDKPLELVKEAEEVAEQAQKSPEVPQLSPQVESVVAPSVSEVKSEDIGVPAVVKDEVPELTPVDPLEVKEEEPSVSGESSGTEITDTKSVDEESKASELKTIDTEVVETKTVVEVKTPEVESHSSPAGKADIPKKDKVAKTPEATKDKVPEESSKVEEERPRREMRTRKASKQSKPEEKKEEMEMPTLEQESPLIETKDQNEAGPPTLEKPEEPVTIGSALTFDYNPPPSPDSDENAAGQLVMDVDTGKRPGRPQRAVRGRGRPKRSAAPAAAVAEEAKAVPTSPREGGDSRESSTPTTDAAPSPAALLDGPVLRQSRRIAQIKQKEEEERRKQEAEVLADMQRRRELELQQREVEDIESSSSDNSESDSDKQKAANGSPRKKKRKYTKKKKATNDEDYIGVADEDIASLRKRKKKKKRKKKRRAGANPWESSDTSDSSSQSDGLEPEEEEEDDEPRELKSDHEFSPESDLELGPGEELQPAPRRARTARRDKTSRKDKKEVAEEEQPEEDEYRCQKCNGGDQPEWILLCDNCDNGWHTSCLKPEIHLVPEGDWYCPECAHQLLISNLTEDEEEEDDAEDPLQAGDSAVSEAGSSLQEAIAGVGGSGDEESSGTATSSSSSSSSSSEDEDDKYPLRQRRAAQTVSYSFQAYDELINSAIQVNLSSSLSPSFLRGKLADKAEAEAKQRQHAELVKLSQRRKPRRLACLDVSSEDDHASDEDFHGSLSDEDEDDEEALDVDSDDSAAYRGSRSKGPVRRSTRARQTRYDREFIDDDSDDSEAEKKRRKAKRARGWLGSDDELAMSEISSESGESDWGGSRKRKRKAPTSTRSRAPAKRRKRAGGGKKRKGAKKGKTPARKRQTIGSDSEGTTPRPAPKPKRPKPPPREPSPEGEPQRRATRGRKINYQEIVGSDSDDAVPRRGKGRRIVSDDEEEFNPDEEDTGPPRTGKPSSVLHNPSSSRVIIPPPVAPVAPPPVQPSAAPPQPAQQAPPPPLSGVPVTAAALQQSLGGGPIPQIVEVGRDSDNSEEDEASSAPRAGVITAVPAVISPPSRRGSGAVRRGRGRGRGRPPASASAAGSSMLSRALLNKVIVSSNDESEESDSDLPATLPRPPKLDDPAEAKPPAYSPATAPVPPQYPPQGAAPPSTQGGNPPPNYPSPPRQGPLPQPSQQQQQQSPTRYPPPPPGAINYRPPMRMRGAPPNVGMSYPPTGILESTDKSLTPPPSYRPVMPPQQAPPRFQRGAQFQPPPPYPPGPQGPYFSPFSSVDDAPPPQYPPSYAPSEAFSGPQEPGSYEVPPHGAPVAQRVGPGGEEESGEFGGLVSYFSSQREDDLES